MSGCEGTELGGVDDLASAVVSLPTVLALFAVFFAAMQGVLALESADPCRLSSRKMNTLLILELAEVVVSLISEVMSFVELRSALANRFQTLHWIAPCLLAAGLLETLVDVYFTLAVVTKSRVGWLPLSATGSTNTKWEVVPFVLTFSLSMSLVGWRLRWWWKSICVSTAVSEIAVSNEPALRIGVMGFAVGWAVGISALVFVIIMLADCAEDGANYVGSIPYLWKPDKWIDEQHGDIKVWYRTADQGQSLEQYVASAVLDSSVPLPETENEVFVNLERQPLHCGNAIVGSDGKFIKEEDRGASRLHKVILLAEHVVVLPLLIVVVVIISRLHNSLDENTFEVLRQLTDAVIIIAFLEIAIGVKTVLWSFSGVAQKERAVPSNDHRIEQLQALAEKHAKGVLKASQDQQK